MATGPAVEKVRVVVVWEDEDKERLYKLAPTTEVSEILALVAEDEGREEMWTAKKARDGLPLTGDEQIGDISEGREVVPLYVHRRPVEEAAEAVVVEKVVEEMATLSFSVFGQHGDIRELTVSLSKKPGEIHPDVRETFDIPEGRYFRLMRLDGPLEYNLPLSEVSVPVNSPILVDLGYEVEIEVNWSDCTETYFVYASECLSEVVEMNPRCRRRVYLEDSQIDSCRSLSSILPAHMRNMTKLQLRHVYQRCVTILVNGKWKSFVVWPEETLAKILPSTSEGQVWRYEGQNVESSHTFLQIRLKDGGLLLQDQPVLVHYSSGEAAVLWMPQLSTVAHLRERILRKEMDNDFCLRLNGRILRMEESAHQKTDSGDAISVVRSENDFVVDLDGKEVQWTSRKGDMRFEEFCDELLRNGNLRWKDLVDLEFRCNGCYRQIRRCEEEFQLLPADCCRVRSLRLSSYNPVEVKDRAAQGQSRSDHTRAMRDKRFGHRTDVQGGICQTRLEAVDSTTETCEGLGRVAASIQHPSPSLRPFCLYNYSGNGQFQWEYRKVSLLLPSSPTAGQMTTAAAVDLGLRPEETVIRRLVGVSHGVRIVQVEEEERDFFTTEDGRRRVEVKDAEDKKNEFWTIDDTAAIVLPPGRCLLFNVGIRRR